MPTIDVDLPELEKLLGVAYKGDIEKLDETLAFVKGEVKLYNSQESVVSIEIKDTNRPDLWSVEGLARALNGYINHASKPKAYAVRESLVDVSVDSRLATIRPFMGVAIVKDLKLSDTVIRGFMHLQDKLDQTYGRNRQKTSIGLYDFSLIIPPLRYTVARPDEISFTPLGFSEEMTLAQILERHPKGIEYGSIVKKHRVYPIIMDSANKVLSFPPIINSNDLGRVTSETPDVLVEVTGTSQEAVLNALTLVTLALADRGGKVHTATLQYKAEGSQVVTPDFRSKLMELGVEYTNKILGLQLGGKQIAELLGIAGFRVENVAGDKVGVLVPCHRVDVMHPVDLVEDVAIAYGYNLIAPIWRDLPTTGSTKPEQHLIDKTRELIVGLGFQEIMTNNLTSPEALFDKMGCEKSKIVEVANPKVATMTCLRNWLLPSLMEFLSNNKSVEFPQRIFELAKVTLLDETKETRTRDENWVAAVATHASASFTEIKSTIDSLLMNLGLTSRVKEVVHPSYIDGRVGEVVINEQRVGIIGEIHPGVLERWKLENPASAFEINLDKIILIMQSK
jgi:phenylalanyl-tRNA synthetase beta chain